jgi:hypothetical protein
MPVAIRAAFSYFLSGRICVVRNTRSLAVGSILVSLISFSCNQPFSPKAPFEEKPVVYSVFVTNRNTQIVRVYSNYNVSGFDPFENASEQPLAGSVVTVIGPRGTYAFRDTLISRTDTSRYKTPIPAYVSNWRPEPMQTYILTVQSAKAGTSTATVTTPAKALNVYWYYPTDFMDYPDSIKYETGISASASVASEGNPYFVQLTIEYAVSANSGSRIEEIEVPAWATSNTSLWATDTTFKYATYPSLQISSRWGVGMFYNKWAYRYALTQVSNKYQGKKLTFRRVVFRLLQLDENWYSYYNTVRRAQDPMTMRLDQPDFTNLTNGYGVVGACTVDSLIHYLPADFAWNR